MPPQYGPTADSFFFRLAFGDLILKKNFTPNRPSVVVFVLELLFLTTTPFPMLFFGAPFVPQVYVEDIVSSDVCAK